VVVHAGSVIGSDGFGYKHRHGVHIKFPQVGTVLIERDVEIGANTCIDRAALGRTVIGAGTKIDNHVHIAHNVQVGKGVLICGQTGIGGSSVIEDYAVLASQSGVADHVRVGRGAKVLAQAGVIGDVKSGSEVVGFPAIDRKQAMRETVTLRRLVALYKPLKTLVDLLPTLTDRSPRGG
jgi:UDP-3-O-[3-hydroxymyristoyl] glucosamine N-acyltransferase